MVRCLGNTSPAETPANKGVLEDLVKCEVFFCFTLYLYTETRRDRVFYAILGSPIVVNLKEIPVITIII